MRGVKLSALAVSIGLWAGAADAATWTFTGTSDDIGYTSPALETDTSYYVQFVSDLPWDNGPGSFFMRNYVYFEGHIVDYFTVEAPLTAEAKPWGFYGRYDPPVQGQPADHAFGPPRYSFYANLHAPVPDGTPWMITISTDPIAPPAGAVPEPATWAMMIAGFGMIGMAARRRFSISPA